MAFWDEFKLCMHSSYLPTPNEIYGAVEEIDVQEALEELDKLKDAAEAAGGLEITFGALETAGEIGLGGLAFDITAVTVAAYVGACTGCLIGATGSSIYDYLAQANISSDLRNDISIAADDAGLAVG
jgi:hypothetical protein